MLTLIIIAGVAALLAFFVVAVDYGFWEGIGCAFMAACGGAFVAFFVAMILGACLYTGSHWKVTDRTALVNLADGSDTHGRWGFLGSGYLDSAPSFTWYESDGKNSYVRQDVPASQASVHYLTSKQTPYYTIKTKKADEPGFMQKWGFQMGSYGETYYDFYIPKGSIVQSYVLDNK